MSGFRRDNNANSIINAQLLDPTGGSYNYSAAVPNPQSRMDLSPRIDFQLTPTNTLSFRYMYDRQKSSNNGVSQFALQTQGYDTSEPGKYPAGERHPDSQREGGE